VKSDDSCKACKYCRKLGRTFWCKDLDAEIVDVAQRLVPYGPGVYGLPRRGPTGRAMVLCEKYVKWAK
jgi:hypothetical protein